MEPFTRHIAQSLQPPLDSAKAHSRVRARKKKKKNRRIAKGEAIVYIDGFTHVALVDGALSRCVQSDSRIEIEDESRETTIFFKTRQNEKKPPQPRVFQQEV